MKKTENITVLLAVMLLCSFLCSTGLPDAKENEEGVLPFSWETMPVHAHLANRSDDFTSEQLDFLAKHYDFICIEKGVASRKHGSTEKGFAIAFLSSMILL